MAKVSFNKVTPIKNIDPKVINICGEDVTVIQYLPIADKIAMVETIAEAVIDNTGFSSPIRLEVHFYLELIKTYTNISITDKMIENSAKTYDLLECNHIIEEIVSAIPEEEFDTIFDYVTDTIKHMETYNTSFAGVLKATSNDYTATEADVQTLLSELGEVQDNSILQGVLAKLG